MESQSALEDEATIGMAILTGTRVITSLEYDLPFDRRHYAAQYLKAALLKYGILERMGKYQKCD